MHTSPGDRRFQAAGVATLVCVVLLWLTLSAIAVSRQGTWADETGYILKSWWYIGGTVHPYSAEDATWYQPLIFYVIGIWQRIFGHDVATSRSLTVVFTAINMGLLAALLRRLNCGICPIVFAIVVFALTEDSIFYFSSATPYAFSVCLQLIALHLMLTMRRNADYAVVVALAVVLTMIYFVRINLVSFIAVSLAIVWVRAGRDRWRVYFFSAATFILTWSMLAWVWGSRFIYVSLWFPNITEWLFRSGGLPPLFPHALSLSHQMLMIDSPPRSLAEQFSYVFGQDIMVNWFLAHHVLPVAAAVFALAALAVRRMPNRGWIATFVAAYIFLLLFHHLGAQSYCPICIQAYANYLDYLGALAGALALNGLSESTLRKTACRMISVAAIVLSLVLASLQSWYLVGSNRLPSIRNQETSLSSEVRQVSDGLWTLLPANSVVGFVGSDSRIPLALYYGGIRVPPVSLTLASSYRRLNDNLTAEQRALTVAEIGQLSFWTDPIAENWMRNDFEFVVVQRRPDRFPSWLVWAPEAPLVKRGLAKCFERVDNRTFDNLMPPLSIDLYRRTNRGEICVSD